MKWTEKAWDAVQPLFHKTIQLPFIQELMNGTLDRKKFLFYIEQDSIYLASYGKLLTGIATQLKDPLHRKEFIAFAGENMEQERDLHASFIQHINVDTEPTPACLLYSSFLLQNLAIEPVEVAIAGVMPCFRVYQEVGLYIHKHQSSSNNPYQEWINTYSYGEHIDSVTRAEKICNELAAKATPEIKEAMLKAYITSTKLEYLFWDSAYTMKAWPL